MTLFKELIWEGKYLDMDYTAPYPFLEGQWFKNSRNEYLQFEEYLYVPSKKKLAHSVKFRYLRGDKRLVVDIWTTVKAMKEGKLKYSARP